MSASTIKTGDTIRARWAVGNATQGSGWVAARFVREDDPTYTVEVDAWGMAMVIFPGGGRATIYEGQYVIV